ncbi:hypothetical protein [Pseudobacillus badius]|uniref:hypothetical protein n=1 Tax=Bacillus badius TaxID=1455 RepID=UPI0007B34312|nr:hypothetical protein [Bacillus badius]KZR57517.1 hypothetical protein A3781_19685 [Bacillus badius]
MTSNQITSMTQYYTEKYGTPVDDNDALYKLTSIYKELFGEVPSQEVKEGIAEYFRLISERELPAYLWILESLHVTSKKDKSKRNFPYCVGMLRTWLKYGFGHIPNQEEDELVKYFQEVTGFDVTYKARKILQNLMGQYGLIKVTRMINDLKDNTDKGLLLMIQLQSMMDDKFNQTNYVEDYYTPQHD